MSKYLDRLKSEKRLPSELTKLTEAPFVSNVSTEGRHKPENTPFQQFTFDQKFTAETERRADFCNTHRKMLGGSCARFKVIEHLTSGNRMSALDACLLWRLVRVGQKIELAAGAEVVSGITVGDVVNWVSASPKDLKAMRNERRLLLTVAETLQGG